jgi:chemotaxis protein MotB
LIVPWLNDREATARTKLPDERDSWSFQDVRYSGIVELNGLATRTKIKHAARIRPEDSSVKPTPDGGGCAGVSAAVFALAVTSLRQSLRDMPELASAPKHTTFEETSTGLNIEIVDQDGSAMFPKAPRSPTRAPTS